MQIPSNWNAGGKIADFGLAKFQSNTKRKMGTKGPYYSAPEVEKNSSSHLWTQKADIFSLGICQAELIAQHFFWIDDDSGDDSVSSDQNDDDDTDFYLMDELKVIFYLRKGL